MPVYLGNINQNGNSALRYNNDFGNFEFDVDNEVDPRRLARSVNGILTNRGQQSLNPDDPEILIAELSILKKEFIFSAVEFRMTGVLKAHNNAGDYGSFVFRAGPITITHNPTTDQQRNFEWIVRVTGEQKQTANQTLLRIMYSVVLNVDLVNPQRRVLERFQELLIVPDDPFAHEFYARAIHPIQTDNHSLLFKNAAAHIF